MANAEAVQANLLIENRSRNKILTSHDLNSFAAASGRHGKLRRALNGDSFTGTDATEDALTDAEMSVAIAADRMLYRDDSTLDVSDPAQLAFVDVLIAAGVWVAADKTALVALGTETVSRAVEIGCTVKQKQADGSYKDNVRLGWIERAGIARA